MKIKVGGKIYKFHKYDADIVNPPEIHGHDIESGNKVGGETGTVYDRKGKKRLGNIGKKNLKKLKKLLKKGGIIGVTITAVEIYDMSTADQLDALENIVDMISGHPEEAQQLILNEIISKNPDLFQEVQSDLCP